MVIIMTHLVGTTAVVITGLMVGVEFAVAAFVNPLLGRLPDPAFGAARSGASRVLGKWMPYWYIATAVLLVGAAALAHRCRRGHDGRRRARDGDRDGADQQPHRGLGGHR